MTTATEQVPAVETGEKGAFFSREYQFGDLMLQFTIDFNFRLS